ncbi:MAG: transporter substrate-binding domain-containing protein [Rhodospirillales bacterium]|nr:transporter substrate-binding domain-containing protein [Rhodospirillales bacterium]
MIAVFFRSRFNLLLFSFSLSAILYLCFVSALQADPKPVVIAADPWCPFICDTGGPQQGLMVDIAKEALALSGYELSYQNINWARAKRMVRAGIVDGIVGTAKSTPERTPYHFPETALGVVETCFFRRASDDWEYKSPRSLASQTMGWINDYVYGSNPGLNDWVIAHKETPQVLTVTGTDTHARLFKLLLARRISTFAEVRSVINYELRNLGLQEKIEMAGCIKPIEKVYVAFSKKIAHGELLAKALDEGVDKLRHNGRLGAILETYGLNEETWVPR